MARPKASETQLKDPPVEAAPGPGHNDRAERNLFFHHKRMIRAAIAKNKATANELRDAWKRAASEIGEFAKEDIKESLKVDTDGTPKRALATIARQLRHLRWMGFGVRSQGELFSEEPNEDVSPREAGVLAALNGDSADANPYERTTQAGLDWEYGYEDGVKEYLEWQRGRDAEDWDGTPAGRAAAEESPGPDDGGGEEEQ